jgi:hypothetical protein
MKKTMILLFFLLSAAAAFASGSVDIHGGLPLAYQNLPLGGGGQQVNWTEASMGLSGGVYFTPAFGLNLYSEVQFPFHLRQDTGGAPDERVREEVSRYALSIGIDILAGPSYVLYRKDKLQISAALGYHFNGLFHKKSDLTIWTKFIQTQQGIGGLADVAFQVNKLVYFFARGQFSYDFYVDYNSGLTLRVEESGFYSFDQQKYRGRETGIQFVPRIGVGLLIGSR